MSSHDSLRARLLASWRRLREAIGSRVDGERGDREHREEVEFHLAMAAAELEQRGLPPDEARRRAHAAFGGVQAAREAAREARGGRLRDDLGRDLALAIRQLQHAPGYAVAVVATLALGIGASTALFSVVDGVLLRRPPVDHLERLVVVWETDRASGTTREPAAWPDYIDFAAQGAPLDAIAAVAGTEASFTPRAGEPVRVTTMGVTHAYFALMGVRPLHGRPFTADEDSPGGARVALVGEAFWRRHLDADPAIVGRMVRVDDVERQVVGVLPAGADFALDQVHARAAYRAPYSGQGEVAIWVPLQASAEAYPRETHPFFVVGRLAPRVTRTVAQEEFTRLAARLEAAYPSNAGRGVFVEPLAEVAFAPVRPVFLLLVAAVALVLLVACVNVANLLLARSLARTREVAVRRALGATPERLVRQFLAESLLLSIVGGTVGVGGANAALRGLLALAPASLPRIESVGIDLRVLGVTLAVSLVVGIVFGLVPTWQARDVAPADALHGDGRSVVGGAPQTRLREVLVVGELALSVSLVLCAGLLARSLSTVFSVDPGFDTRGVLKAEFTLPEARYPRDYRRFPDWPATHRLSNQLMQRVSAIPGVTSVALASAHPLDAGFTNSFTVVGREAEAAGWPEIAVRLVSPSYFATMGSRLVRGRLLTTADDARAPLVAVLNEAAAERYFAGREPFGAEISFWGIRRRVVGIVASERQRGLTAPAPAALFVPIAQAPPSSASLLVRATRDVESLTAEVRRAVQDIDPQLSLYGVEPLALTLLGTEATRRFALRVLGAFAALTLLLAIVGVYGVLSYLGSLRQREIGIRLALGATRSAAAGVVVRAGTRLALLGTAMGLAGGWVGSRLLANLLWGIGRGDPLTHAAVAGVALAAAAFATALPAVRAARIVPSEALRLG